MKKTPIQLLESAIEKDELSEFLRGEKSYSIFPGPNEYDEPTSASYVLDTLYKYYNATKNQKLIHKLQTALLSIIEDNLGIFMAVCYISTYLYHLHLKKASFLIDMNQIIDTLRDSIENKRDALIADTRWSGSQWDSQERNIKPTSLGLYGSILLMGYLIKKEHKLDILSASGWNDFSKNSAYFTQFDFIPEIKKVFTKKRLLTRGST